MALVVQLCNTLHCTSDGVGMGLSTAARSMTETNLVRSLHDLTVNMTVLQHVVNKLCTAPSQEKCV